MASYLAMVWRLEVPFGEGREGSLGAAGAERAHGKEMTICCGPGDVLCRVRSFCAVAGVLGRLVVLWSADAGYFYEY